MARSKSPIRIEQPSLVEDVLKGNYWTSGTETCQMCFKSLFEAVKSHGVVIKEIEKTLNSKVSFSEFQASLSGKADYVEVFGKISELQGLIEKKASLNDVELCISLSSKPSDGKNIDLELRKKVESKDFSETVEGINGKLQLMIKNNELRDKILDNFSGLDRRISQSDQEVKEIKGNIEKILKNLEDLERNKGIFAESLKSLEKGTEDTLKFSFGYKAKNESANFWKFQEETAKKIEKIENKLEEMKKSKPDKSEIRAVLQEINFQLHSKLALLSKSLEEKEKENFDSKPGRSFETPCSVPQITQKIEKIQKELVLKAPIKDLCTLLDLKADIKDVNKALQDIHKELDCKSSVYPQGIWSFYYETSQISYSSLKISRSLPIILNELDFTVQKTAFFSLKIIIFSEECSNLALLKNGKRFLVHTRNKSEQVFSLKQQVLLTEGDIIELVVPCLSDIKGLFHIWEILS